MPVFDLGDERQEPEIEIEFRHRAGEAAHGLVEALLEHARRSVAVEPGVSLFQHVPKDLEVFLERFGRIGLQRIKGDGCESGRLRPEALDDLGADAGQIVVLPRRSRDEDGCNRNVFIFVILFLSLLITLFQGPVSLCQQ